MWAVSSIKAGLLAYSKAHGPLIHAGRNSIPESPRMRIWPLFKHTRAGLLALALLLPGHCSLTPVRYKDQPGWIFLPIIITLAQVAIAFFVCERHCLSSLHIALAVIKEIIRLAQRRRPSAAPFTVINVTTGRHAQIARLFVILGLPLFLSRSPTYHQPLSFAILLLEASLEQSLGR